MHRVQSVTHGSLVLGSHDSLSLSSAPSLGQPTVPQNLHEPASSLICSARRCGATAQWLLRWNNPALHTPDRRKVWLACPDHIDSLTDYLQSRGFLRETAPASDPDLRLPI